MRLASPSCSTSGVGRARRAGREMPGFQAVYERNADDFVMVGLDVGPIFGLGTRNSALQLLSDMGITYPAANAVSRDPSPCLEPTHCLLHSSLIRTVT